MKALLVAIKCFETLRHSHDLIYINFYYKLE